MKDFFSTSKGAAFIAALVGLAGVVFAVKPYLINSDSASSASAVAEGQASEESFKNLLTQRLSDKLKALDNQLQSCENNLASLNGEAAVSRSAASSDDTKILMQMADQREKDLKKCHEAAASAIANRNNINDNKAALEKLKAEVSNMNAQLNKCHKSRNAGIVLPFSPEDNSLSSIQAQIAIVDNVKSELRKELVKCMFRATASTTSEGDAGGDAGEGSGDGDGGDGGDGGGVQ